MRALVLVLLLLCPFGCARREHFQGVTFNDDARLDGILRSWFSKHLSGLDEAPLDSSRDTWRFLWLRSFHHPVAIRVELDQTAATLHLKVSDGAGGYEPGRIIVNAHRALTRAELGRLQKALAAAKLWTLPTSDERFAIDGARWILEARSGNRYHVVQRHSPRPGPFRDLCLLFIELSDLRTEIY